MPSRYLPFPAGYQHDLSLITGPDMPWLKSPAGVASVDGWAQYEDALDGQPVFTCLFNAWIDKLKILEGNVAARATQQAVVVGSEYLWLKKSHSQSASILWRTEIDWASSRGWTGSALCVGKPTELTAKALVFQNFERPIRSGEVAATDRPLVGDNGGWVIKGGFLLPQEIREAEIMQGEPSSRPKTWYSSTPSRARTSADGEGGRREFSAPY